ncbi:MAG: hypothetical protein M3Z75_06375 [Actinomycetota bacterium]|nr:hypothetical protein [Actinomycetota bacterium]
MLAQAALTIFIFLTGQQADCDVLCKDGTVIATASQTIIMVPFAVGSIAAIPLYHPFAGRETGG